MSSYPPNSHLERTARVISGFEQGALDAHQNVDLADGIFEDQHAITCESGHAGGIRDHHGGLNPLKAFSSTGKVGKEFNPEGKAGSTAESLGGPFHRDGAIGRQFRSDGSVGGTMDEALGEKDRERRGERLDNVNGRREGVHGYGRKPDGYGGGTYSSSAVKKEKGRMPTEGGIIIGRGGSEQRSALGKGRDLD